MTSINPFYAATCNRDFALQPVVETAPVYARLSQAGKFAILMGDYCDREAGFISLTYHTKNIAFAAGLRQCCTDIIRFSHGASSSKKVYRSSFSPGLHDVCMVFEKAPTRA
jgi:hypothetical protein